MSASLTWMNRASQFPMTDAAYFAHLTRAVMGDGLGPKVVESRWPAIESALDHFQPEAVAQKTEYEMIRNRRKLEATIRNAHTALRLITTYTSFQLYLDALVGREAPSRIQLDAATEVLADTFAHLGRTSAQYFLYACGYRTRDDE